MSSPILGETRRITGLAPGNEPIVCEYQLAEVNRDLQRRLHLIREASLVYTDVKAIEREKEYGQILQEYTSLTDRYTTEFNGNILGSEEQVLAELVRKIAELEALPKVQSLKTTKQVGRTLITYTTYIKRPDAAIQQLQVKKGLMEQITQRKDKMRQLSCFPEGVKEKLLEEKIRGFDGEWLRQNVPKLNEVTALNERFSSYIHDVKRPLLTFRINGMQVFENKEGTPEEIHKAVVATLDKYHLSLPDLYTVLEFFHQGGTAQGYAYLTSVVDEGHLPTGAGAATTLDLQIDEQAQQLLRLTSNVEYIITNIDDKDEEQMLMGIIENEGVKMCTTVYDFQKETVNFSMATRPFNVGEVSAINARYYPSAKSKD